MMLLPFPDTRQTTDFDCGASSLQGVLYYYGIEVREDRLMEKLDTNEDEGTTIAAILRIAREFGLRAWAGQMTLRKVKQCLDRRVPVILMIQAWPENKEEDLTLTWDNGHYVVAVGYDEQNVYFNDPVLLGNHGFLSFSELEARWHDVDRNRRRPHWGLVIWGRTPQYDPSVARRIQARRIAARWVARHA